MILPSDRWRHAADVWRRVDDLGFAHAWTFDHVTWRDLPDGPWFAALPTLAAAAAVTRRVALGMLVATPNFRHPVPLAKEAMTLHDTSAGRFILGLGAGGGGADATVIAREPWSAAERADRFAEFATLTTRLLRERRVDHHGAYYHSDGVSMSPGCPGLRVAVAATGPRGLRIAARHADIWVTNGHTPRPGLTAAAAEPGLVARQVARFRELCAETGRSPDRMLVLANRDSSPPRSYGEFMEAAHAYREAGITDLVVPYPRTAAPFAGDAGVFERIAAELTDGALRDGAVRCAE
ncbi:LLM class flavin-dependent oxidoreductase [Spirillospora sp. CA-294931]|uniref:LLM class flavin-dependent oxidoreductase n=1 Tax=Spirillospora sp. CA-294931 TaxID=3240042 RepID=UPI003D8E3F6E